MHHRKIGIFKAKHCLRASRQSSQDWALEHGSGEKWGRRAGAAWEGRGEPGYCAVLKTRWRNCFQDGRASSVSGRYVKGNKDWECSHAVGHFGGGLEAKTWSNAQKILQLGTYRGDSGCHWMARNTAIIIIFVLLACASFNVMNVRWLYKNNSKPYMTK